MWRHCISIAPISISRARMQVRRTITAACAAVVKHTRDARERSGTFVAQPDCVCVSFGRLDARDARFGPHTDTQTAYPTR